MARIVWTEPALSDLDAIADYIALENPAAARKLVRRIMKRVGQLQSHPDSGPMLPEFEGSRYRQLIEPPCRIFYRHVRPRVYVLHIIRSECRLRRSRLAKRGPEQE